MLEPQAHLFDKFEGHPEDIGHPETHIFVRSFDHTEVFESEHFPHKRLIAKEFPDLRYVS